jgi:hypothetical protein
MTPQHRIDAFAARLIRKGLVLPDDLVGCSPREITELEQRFGVCFPESYRCFLIRMGHRAGKLFDWDHVDVYYRDIDRLNRIERDCVLPEKAFIIMDRMEEQFQFIVCDSPDDSPVYWWGESEEKIRKVYDGIVEWLDDWYSGAAEALDDGYLSHQV